MRLQAATNSAGAGTIDLMPLNASRVARIDLTLARVSANPDTVDAGEIAGVVTGEDRQPIRNALIVTSVVADVRTGDDGHFIVRGVPAGMRQIEVRAIGMGAVTASVDVVAHETKVVEVQLAKVTVLDSVRVVANGIRQQIVHEIDARRRQGFGHFSDSTQVATHPNLFTVFSDIPSVIVNNPKLCPARNVCLPGSGTQIKNGPCVATLWIDGKKQSAGVTPDHTELQYLHTDQIAMIETYTRMSDAPAQYISRGKELNQCGVVLIWTKFILP